MTTSLDRLLASTAMAAALLLAAPVQALPVLFTGGNVTVDGVAGAVGNIEAGQTVTVEGALLQLQAADGSIVTFAPGSTFRLTGEGDNISFELISGSMRVASNGTPISVTRGGVTISTSGGAFSAFEGEGGGLEGRVNEGTATVANGAGTRDFAKGEGYVATETSIAGTFTPPAATTPQYLLAAFDSEGGDYSPADDQGPGGAQIVDGAGGGYGGTPPVTGVIVPLEGDEFPGYTILYAADSIGIDGREDASVTIGSGGELNQYDLEPGYEERLERNSNQSLERGDANGNIFIERWAGGETRGNYYNVHNGDTFSSMGRTSHQGFHIVYGMPTPEADLPVTGTAIYSLVAATNPTMDNGRFAPGTFDGELGITFGPSFLVGIDFSVDMPGDHVYLIQTAGGAAAPSAAPSYTDFANGIFRVHGIAIAEGGAACPSSNCDASIYGLFGGAAGEDVGIVYRIMDFTADMDDLFRGTQISGAAAFTQASFSGGGGGGGSSQTEVGDVKTDWQVAFGGGSVDVRHESEVYIDGDDTVNSWRWTAASGSWGRGTKPAEDAGGVADVIAWSRWGTGTPDIYSNVNSEWEEFGLAGSIAQHYHVVVGAPVTNLPVGGTADYDLIGGTRPTMTDDPSTPGTLTSAAMRIDFATQRVGLELAASQGGNDWSLETPGGLAGTAASGMQLVAQGSVGFVPPDFFYGNNNGAAGFAVEASLNGNPCGACVSDVRGFVAGDGVSHAGLTYRFSPNFGDPSLIGAAAFAKAP